MRPYFWAFLALTTTCSAASAELACSGSSSGLGCFDALTNAGPAEPSPFRWFGRGRVLGRGRVATTVVLRHAASPAELVVPSPDPEGRMLPVVRRTTRLDLRLAVGLGRDLDLTLAEPIAMAQFGSGPDALLTQTPTPLAHSGFGDPRLSFRIKLPEDHPDFDWALRLELTFPFGSERAYIGNRGMTESLAVNGHYTQWGLSLVTDAGLLVSRKTRFGDVNLGAHAFLGLGLDYAPFSTDVLHVAIEGLLRPSLIAAPPLADAVGHPNWVMPAEWLFSASTRPFSLDLWFSLAAGTGLPFSHRNGSSPGVDAWFVAPTAPRWQLLSSMAVAN